MLKLKNSFKNIPQAETKKEVFFLSVLKMEWRATREQWNVTFDFGQQAIVMNLSTYKYELSWILVPEFGCI